jgi:galactonate dehydratase
VSIHLNTLGDPVTSVKPKSEIRIKDVELHSIAATHASNWTFMRICCEQNLSGWGEVTLRSHEGIMQAVLEQLRGHLIGKRGGDLGRLRQALPSLPSGRAGNAVLSGIDQCLFDLEAQAAGVPLHRLLSDRPPHSLKAYATVNRSIRERTPHGFAEAAKAAATAGFGGIKIMPFDRILPHTVRTVEGRQEFTRAIERIAAVRGALLPTTDLMVDCHWRLDEVAAIDFINEVAAFGLTWIECPVPESALWHEAIGRLRERANSKNMALAGGENAVGTAGFAPLVKAGLYDVVMPDIKYCGGHREFAAICDLAAQSGVTISPHNPSGPIAHAHTVHACTAIGLTAAVEQQFDESPLFDGCMVSPAPTLSGGHFECSETPGLGAAVDLSVAALHPLRPVPFNAADPSFV